MWEGYQKFVALCVGNVLKMKFYYPAVVIARTTGNVYSLWQEKDNHIIDEQGRNIMYDTLYVSNLYCKVHNILVFVSISKLRLILP